MVVGNGYIGEESVGIKQVNSTSITICFVLFDYTIRYMVSRADSKYSSSVNIAIIISGSILKSKTIYCQVIIMFYINTTAITVAITVFIFIVFSFLLWRLIKYPIYISIINLTRGGVERNGLGKIPWYSIWAIIWIWLVGVNFQNFWCFF